MTKFMGDLDAADGDAGTEEGGGDGHDLGALQSLAQALLVAAGQMADLVGEDADQLVRRLGHGNRAGVDEDPPTEDEGVEVR